ncbi:MAG: glycosyltransferase family 2 protein [Burkholderiales bacterium]
MSEVATSRTHLVLIPSYNAGDQALQTVQAALAQWQPVWVVIDGSTDGSGAALERLAISEPGLRVFVLAQNQGKGAAVLHGLEAARHAGFTHALTMDSDGQHPADLIDNFMAESRRAPGAMILGKPVFDTSAPAIRVNGRKLSNGWVHLQTLGAGVGDSLFGFRVYPIAPLIEVMRNRPWMRRFDFDPEVVVRLCWAGVTPINIDAPVKYLSASEGGVSHFKYGRDNVLLTWMHARLLASFAGRLPRLLYRKFARRHAA